MLLLVAAAIDTTGRTITLLTAALIGIAVGLGLLTIWYWRHTNPRSRIRRADFAPSADHSWDELTDPASLAAVTTDIIVARPPVPSASSPSKAAAQPPLEADPVDASRGAAVARRAAGSGPNQGRTAITPDDAPHGLDEDQWAVLAQAVLENFIGEPAEPES